MIRSIIKKVIFPLLAALAVFVLSNHDDFLYHQPIGIIEKAQTSSISTVRDEFGNVDKQITQHLTLRLLNTSKQGHTLTLSNTLFRSQALGQIYSAGQTVVLKRYDDSYQIFGLKRDAIILSLITLFIGLLISFINWRKSLFLLLSLLFNLFYFIFAIFLHISVLNMPTLVLFAFLSLLFTSSSLLFVLGPNKQMLITLLTTILSTILTFLICGFILVLTHNQGIHYEYLNYVTVNPSIFFFAGSLISVLGAIMDGTGDIVAGLFGLKRQDEYNHLNLKVQTYFSSGLSIGREITGTLINVLFMIFMAETFPLTLLLLHNGNSWNNIFDLALNLGLLQTLISAIGIVLSIPVTVFITSLFLMTSPLKKRGQA